MAHVSGFYPITIRESRYSGSYAGGRWVLIAGVHRPADRTPAFDSDTPCNQFWQQVRRDGPILEMEDYRHPSGRTVEYYVESGDNPSELLKSFTEYVETEYEDGDD